jgi:hypothetical protein
MRPPPQDLSSGGTKRAVSGNVFWERWGREGRRLIRDPVTAIHRNRSHVRPPHAVITCPWNRKGIAVTGRTESNTRFVSHAAMPASKIAAVNAKNISASSPTVWRSLAETKLRKQIPVARRQFRLRTVGPVFGNHFLRVCQTSADGN